jgi:exo-beta-1,3-glucanase (GH17 family)
VECNAVDILLTAIAGKGVKLIVGVAEGHYNINVNGTWVVDQTVVSAQTQQLVTQVANRWDLIEYVTVLNYPTTANAYSVASVAESVKLVKSMIPKHIRVTVPDDWTAYHNHPDLCQVGQDFVTASVMPVYYGVGVDNAGSFVASSRKNVSNTCDQDHVAIVGQFFV